MQKSMSFENNYPEISNSELWKIFTEKAGDDSAFITAVEEICKHGADLSKSIICFFPTFTLHDTTHIDGVCRWMVRLLGDRKNDLTAEEAAVLLMTACCHDVGMSVSEGYENELKKQLKAHFSGTYMEKWGAHFKKYPEDELAFRDTNELTDQMLRRYIRDNHHNRIEKQLPKDWPDALSKKYITRDDIVRLCRSHGLSLPDGGFRSGDPDRIDYNLCAVLLRLADLFDYDALRAPQSLFLLLGLDKPDTPERKKSREEWEKNRAGFFGDVKDGKILYIATFYDPQNEHEVQSYIDWANAELSSCESFISRFAGRWQSFRPPYRVKTDYKRIGYEAGDFHLTMDQDKIIRLLAGEKIYNDPGVFVRELLQNAIDAVLYRRKLDGRFGEDEGLITIRTWDDSEGYSWFRIEDDGTGMDEHIIKDYMLKVGRSYYTSDEYRAEARNAERDTGFKPTSRFGIGILSCFMSDPEETTVEVLTKRYSTDRNNPNKAIRLNITGLHGNYYLTKTDEDHPGQPMHCPPGLEGENENYLRGTGTTICVRVGRYKMGGQFSFKEAVDQYVAFPGVRVRYIDSEFPEGFDYPTQKELMDVVHRMNIGSEETKAYIYPLPDDLFEQLKTASPIMNWNESNRPEIVFRYHPLDVLACSENTTGVLVTIGLRWSEVSCSKTFEINGECYTPKLRVSIWRERSSDNYSLRFDFSYRFSDDYSEDDAIIHNLAKMDKTREFCPDVAYGVMREKTDDFKKIEKAFRGKNQLDGFDLVLSRDGLFQ